MINHHLNEVTTRITKTYKNIIDKNTFCISKLQTNNLKNLLELK